MRATGRFVAQYLWYAYPHFRAAFMVCMAMSLFGVWIVIVMPGDRGAPYLPILFCQLFAASSGFRREADAGYIDALLVRGVSRRRVALVHWALSASPGMLAWMVVGLAEVATLHSGTAFAAASLTALLFVSTIGWALTLAAPRFSAGMTWVMVMGLVAASPTWVEWISRTLDAGPPGTTTELGALVGVVAMIPVLLLVPSLKGTVGVMSVLAGLWLLTGSALTGGVYWMQQRDFKGGSL